MVKYNHMPKMTFAAEEVSAKHLLNPAWDQFRCDLIYCVCFFLPENNLCYLK